MRFIVERKTYNGGPQHTTLVSPLTREGVPRRRRGTVGGTALWDARRRKEHTYPELQRTRRCKLVVLGLEVEGRWSEETTSFIKLLAQHKARQAPSLLQRSITIAVIARRSALLTHAAQQTFAASLIDNSQNLANHTNTEGNEPKYSQLLAEAPPPPHTQPSPTTLSI